MRRWFGIVLAVFYTTLSSTFLATADETKSASAAGPGVYVAAGSVGHDGEKGRIVISTDGKEWKQVYEGGTVPLEKKNHANSNAIRGVVFGEGTFVVHGNPGNSLLYSTNARDWKRATQPNQKSTWFALAHGNDQFVAVNATTLARSDDGITWEANKPKIEGSPWKAGHFRKMAFGNDVFVAVGDNGRLGVTKDGKTWLHHNAPQDKNKRTYGLLFGAGQFVWLRGDGVFASKDGVAWTPVAQEQVKPWDHKDGLWTGKEFLISNAKHGALRSTDGLTWKTYEVPKWTRLHGMTANGVWLRGDWPGKISMSSDNGQKWNLVYKVEKLPGREKVEGGLGRFAYGTPKDK